MNLMVGRVGLRHSLVGEVVKLEMKGMRLEPVLRDFVKLEVPEVW